MAETSYTPQIARVKAAPRRRALRPAAGDFTQALHYVARRFFAASARMELQGAFDAEVYGDMLACASAAGVLPGEGAEARAIRRQIAEWRLDFGHRAISLPTEISNTLLRSLA